MTPVEIVSKYDALGVSLWASDGQLHFKAPANTLNQDHIAELKAVKEELVAYLETLEDIAVTPFPEERYEPFPITDVQAAYLVGRTDSYDFGGVGCHGYVELTMPEMDPLRLERAWHLVIERHDMLRAVVSKDGSQRVLEDVVLPSIAFQDLTGLGRDEVQQRILAVRRELSTRQYDPNTWPLCELALTNTDEGSIVHCSIDMLIADFVSVDIMLSELDQLYYEPEKVKNAPEITFRDVLLFRKLQQDVPSYAAKRKQDRQYWLDRIDVIPEGPELPTLRDQQSSGPVSFTRHSLAMESETWKRLGKKAKAHRLTPSCAVLSAFAETIGRWSAQPAFCLNITLLNRSAAHPQINSIIGDFTDVTILEVTTGSKKPFSERAQGIQDRLWEDMEHDAFSGVEVLREIGRSRDARVVYPVVFTSMLGLEGETRRDGEFMRGARLTYGISQTPQVWIDCQVSERNGQLHLNWDVRDGVFSDGMVEDAFESFKELLFSLADKEVAWADATPLSLPPHVTASREAVNDTARELPHGLLHDGFYKTLQRAPQSRALIWQGREFSYEELGGAVVAVQQTLRDYGCDSHDIVAVIQPKGVWQIASVLGVLFAGAAYVPIDMNEPVARRNAMIENAGVGIVLSQGKCNDLPEGVRNVDVAHLDAGDAALLLPGSGRPDDLAYVIYTSGTTGTPKGVMMAHGAVLNTVVDINDRFDVTEKDVLLGVANLNFDLSVYDIFGAFSAGATLVLPDEDRRSDPGHWAQLMFAHGVTLWNSVPAQMHMLTTFLDGESPLEKALSLRLAMLSGDWISPALPSALRAYCPDVRVMSLGGATEAAIWSIGYAIPKDLGDAPSIPYGTPLGNQTFHVLDSRLQPSPNWVAGHLYIGGAGLALGYLGDEARTAQRFIVHPETGERLYKTGDLGRYRPDGIIEFLGRDDTQVKIRGHRIELGEVESVVRSHPAVAHAVAMITGDTPQQYKLAAFAETCRTDGQDNATCLGDNCRQAGDAATAHVNRDLLGRWIVLSEQTALFAMMCALRTLGLFPNMDARHTYTEVIEIGGISKGNHRLLQRWLDALCSQNMLILDERNGQYRLAVAPPDEEALAASWKEWERAEEEVHYGKGVFNYLKLSGDHLPELLQGQADPLDLLFPQGSMDTAFSAYNDNLVSVCLNTVVREGVCSLARTAVPDRPLRVLEIGAGVGGTTWELLRHLDAFPVEYHFTDISTFFLNEAKENFSRYPWVSYGLFDINKPYWEQGYSAGSFDVIICANMLHNALHAPSVLDSLKELAAPGGSLLVIEATRDIYSLLISMEFKEGLSGFTDIRAETGQTFFTREQWLEMFADIGAEVVSQYPVPEDILSQAGQTAFVVRFPLDREYLSREELATYVQERLPHYMVPSYMEILPAIPLSANGKINRKALEARVGTVEHASAKSGEAPHDGLERSIADIWAAVLPQDDIGRNEDFFAAGGDSLLIAQVVVKMREVLPQAQEWEWDKLMAEVLQEPTVATVAAKLTSGRVVARSSAADKGLTLAGSPLTMLAPGESEQSPMRVLVHTGNGNLASYRHIMPSLIGETGRKQTIAGLSVSDFDGFLHIPQENLIEELGHQYARSIIDSGARSVELIGYCSGGFVALETARALLESGMDVAPLTIVSSGPFGYLIQDEMLMERAFGRLFGADVVKAGHFADEALLEAAIVDNLDGASTVIEPGFLESLAGPHAAVGACYTDLARKEQAQRLADMAGALPDTTGEASDYQLGVVQLLYKVFNHTFSAVAQYEPMPFVHDVRLFLPKDASLQAVPGVQSEIRPFWEAITIGDLNVIEVDGNHMTCMQPPLVSNIVNALLEGEK